MKDFATTYFTMNEEDVIEYAKTRLSFFQEDAELSCKEIGDGNLNYVFKVVDNKNNKSVIIKQAGPFARISDEFKLSPDRNRIESETLRLQFELAPGFVPEMYHYDPVMNCCVMEDLSDHIIMRTALLNYQKFPLFVDHITTFMVNTLLSTSDVVMDHKNKKQRVKQFINPELCEITEDLVYTEPFFDCPRNDVFEGSKQFVKETIWDDNKLALETAKLKFEFMTNAQSLLHGDLHTGSVFIKEDSTKVIDPEFAFYGPIGYDVGNVIANLTFAYVHASATMKDVASRIDYMNYLEQTISDVVNVFKEKFVKAWDEKVTEPVARYQGFKEYYLDAVLRDAAAVTGLELCRRIIGIAHVKDITSIADPKKRVVAEKICLSAGKVLILERDSVKSGADYLKIIKMFEQQF
ncbi:S-methyl-5-thioribose kinase [Bacillaceae bacterium IKA-2]|nr:S-methyl-5-thioribose kinase [Bacillaceae bacterium IKA-2]